MKDLKRTLLKGVLFLGLMFAATNVTVAAETLPVRKMAEVKHIWKVDIVEMQDIDGTWIEIHYVTYRDGSEEIVVYQM